MKNTTKMRLEAARPNISAQKAVKFCLEQLYRDRERGMDEDVCRKLTYEELIGALLLAKDAMKK